MGTLDKIIYLLDAQQKKQVDLCNYIGVKKNAFTNWKAGANHSYKKHIDKIAEFFGVSTDYLLDRTDVREPENKKTAPLYEKQTVYSHESDLPNEERLVDVNQLEQLNELMKSARSLSADKIKALIQVAENMK